LAAQLKRIGAKTVWIVGRGPVILIAEPGKHA
jgi:hypothetical protein